MTPSYSAFCDEFLVFAADLQTGEKRIGADLDWFCANKRPDAPPTWKETIIKDLVNKGYGKDWSSMESRGFFIEGPGLERAETIREAARPKRALERLKTVSRSEWIALGALLVSLVALFK